MITQYSTVEVNFIGTINLLTSDDGGRISPVMSGYRPQMRIGKHEGSDVQGSVELNFVEDVRYAPGDTFQSNCRIVVPYLPGELSSADFSLSAGRQFGLYEGARRIGTLTVSDIIEVSFSRVIHDHPK